MKQDYASGNMKVDRSEWFQPSRGQKGHYVLNLLEYHEDEQEMNYIMEEEVLITTSPLEIEPSCESEPFDIAEQILMESEANEVEEISQQVLQRLQQERKLIFFEVYVDDGNLATELLKRFLDCEVATFSLPHWDFEKENDRKAFLKLVREQKPHFIWCAPPCTKWSSMQRLNVIKAEKLAYILELQKQEGKQHLKLVLDITDICNWEINAGMAMEHPYLAMSWKTKTLESMDGYDAICNRCRTGLCYYDRMGNYVGKVKKPTRIRTNSQMVFEALDLPCECLPGEHVVMDGKAESLKKMQNYERGFVKRAANAIY